MISPELFDQVVGPLFPPNNNFDFKKDRHARIYEKILTSKISRKFEIFQKIKFLVTHMLF